MKAYKKIMILVIICLGVHLSILIYLDKIYFGSKPVSAAVDETAKVSNILIDSNGLNLIMSSDDKYLSYYSAGVIKIINTSTGAEKELKIDSEGRLSFYKWISDKEIITAEKKNINGRNQINFYSFNADSSDPVKTPVKTSEGKEVALEIVSTAVEVKDIEVAEEPLTVFVKLTNEKSALVKIDNKGAAEYIKTTGNSAGAIKLMSNRTSLIYEDVIMKQIKTTDGKNINLTDVKNPVLIGCNKDIAFIGKSSGDKISKLYYGTVSEDLSKWKSIEFKEMVSRKDIYISPVTGKIYINNSLKATVSEVADDGKVKETSYRGLIINIYSKGVTSISEGKLLKTSFK